MTVGHVKAELQVFVNYNVDCRAFHASVLSDSRLLNAAASNSKSGSLNSLLKIHSNGGARVSGSGAERQIIGHINVFWN